MSWIDELVELLRWNLSAILLLGYAIARGFLVVGSITWFVHSLGPDTLGTESSRSALATATNTLLAFLTSSLISSSNTNNGDVRSTVSKLVGSGKMLMTLVGTLDTVCDLQEAAAKYVEAIASAAKSRVAGSGDAHNDVGTFLKEAVVEAHASLASSPADREVFKSIIDQLNQTHGVYGRLVTVRSSRQEPPIVLGYWVTTAVSAASTALVSIDESLGTALVSTCLTAVPAAALYLASVPDPLDQGNSWARASSMLLELESLKKYKESILRMKCVQDRELTFVELTRAKTVLPEKARLLVPKR